LKIIEPPQEQQARDLLDDFQWIRDAA